MIKKKSSKKFWNREYDRPRHLAISDDPAEDAVKFSNWAERNSEWFPFPKNGMVVDMGCGNGRNIIYICEKYRMKGYGVDISDVAIAQAKEIAKDLPIQFEAKSITEKIPLEDESVDVVLDMMTSHCLKEEERKEFLNEILRVLKPFGWFFFKTFVMDGDLHSKRLIAENPADEENAYIHPKIGTYEYVWTEAKIDEVFKPYFRIHKAIKSYKHVTRDGKAYKRRTISVYMEKKRDID